MKTIKLILINVVSFAILLAIVNWACGVYLEKSSKVKRHELPNYKADHDYAKNVFYDYDRVQHRYEPFVGWKMLPYKGNTLQVTKDGRRFTPSPELKNETESVVRFFGGSTMWGEGSDDANTIPALFNAANPQYKVYNHGQLAYNSRQELEELIESDEVTRA